MPELTDYVPNGNTKLYGTVLETFKAMLKLKAEGELHGAVVCMILAVFTEGEDNVSQADRTEPVHASKEALEAGVEFILVSLGQPAEQIARCMSFPPDGAIQVAATPEAMRQTMSGVTHRTHLTMTDYGAPVTSTPLSLH